MNTVANPSTKRSSGVRFRVRNRERWRVKSRCLSNKDCAATARTPPGRRIFILVTRIWIVNVSRSRMGNFIALANLRKTAHYVRFTLTFINSPPTRYRGQPSADCP